VETSSDAIVKEGEKSWLGLGVHGGEAFRGELLFYQARVGLELKDVFVSQIPRKYRDSFAESWAQFVEGGDISRELVIGASG
jgi:hypothetical protein